MIMKINGIKNGAANQRIRGKFIVFKSFDRKDEKFKMKGHIF